VFEDVTPITGSQLALLFGGSLLDGFIGGFINKLASKVSSANASLITNALLGIPEVMVYLLNRLGKMRLSPVVENLVAGMLLDRAGEIASGVGSLGTQAANKVMSFGGFKAQAGGQFAQPAYNPAPAFIGVPPAILQTPPVVVPPSLNRGITEVRI